MLEGELAVKRSAGGMAGAHDGRSRHRAARRPRRLPAGRALVWRSDRWCVSGLHHRQYSRCAVLCRRARGPSGNPGRNGPRRIRHAVRLAARQYLRATEPSFRPTSWSSAPPARRCVCNPISTISAKNTARFTDWKAGSVQAAICGVGAKCAPRNRADSYMSLSPKAFGQRLLYIRMIRRLSIEAALLPYPQLHEEGFVLKQEKGPLYSSTRRCVYFVYQMAFYPTVARGGSFASL